MSSTLRLQTIEKAVSLGMLAQYPSAWPLLHSEWLHFDCLQLCCLQKSQSKGIDRVWQTDRYWEPSNGLCMWGMHFQYYHWGSQGSKPKKWLHVPLLYSKNRCSYFTSLGVGVTSLHHSKACHIIAEECNCMHCEVLPVAWAIGNFRIG